MELADENASPRFLSAAESSGEANAFLTAVCASSNDAVGRIEHRHFGARHVAEPFERRFAGVAARGREDQRPLFIAQIPFALRQQIRQQGERHVLESVRGTVPQFEKIRVLVHLHDGRGIVLEPAVRLLHRREQDVFELGQIQPDDERRALGIRHIGHGAHVGFPYLGKRLGHVQTAVRRKPRDDRLRTCHPRAFISCGNVIHVPLRAPAVRDTSS